MKCLETPDIVTTEVQLVKSFNVNKISKWLSPKGEVRVIAKIAEEFHYEDSMPSILSSVICSYNKPVRDYQEVLMLPGEDEYPHDHKLKDIGCV